VPTELACRCSDPTASSASLVPSTASAANLAVITAPLSISVLVTALAAIWFDPTAEFDRCA